MADKVVIAGRSAPAMAKSNARMRYVGAAACVVCGVYWWRWWQQSKLKKAATSSTMAIEELAFAWLAFSGGLAFTLRKHLSRSHAHDHYWAFNCNVPLSDS